MDRKIVVHLYGGIGNQLFQYTFGEYIRYKYKMDVFYDISSFGVLATFRDLQINSIAKEIPVFETNKYFFSRHTRFYRRISRWFFCHKVGVRYYDNVFDETGLLRDDWKLIYLDGYWQDRKYADWLKENKPDLFQPLTPVPEKIKQYADAMSEEKSISLHIRRGDYLLPSNAHLNVCTEDYYKKAVESLHVDESYSIYVFSDDVEWVKTNLKFKQRTVYVDDKGVKPYWSIYLMSLCRINIISNSTFSWWGTFLNNNSNKMVIAPSKWRNDKENPNLYCEEWKVIKT